MKKKMVILGAGESGVGTALLAQQKGYDVFVSDASLISPVFKNELLIRRIDFEEGVHTKGKIFTAD
ncbi:MAG: UDP-N-acetylmuramoyl-L-alanine--D-glutamate ligase, partial [Ginsengibacter sp.]